MPPPTRGYFASKITRAISARLLQLHFPRNIPPTRKCWFLYIKKSQSRSLVERCQINLDPEMREKRSGTTWRTRDERGERDEIIWGGQFGLGVILRFFFVWWAVSRRRKSSDWQRQGGGPPAAEGTERDDKTLCWNIGYSLPNYISWKRARSLQRS